MLGTSCTLDLRQDPNAVQPDQALPSLILNSMQRNVAVLFNTSSTQGMILSRLQNSGGNDYTNIFNPQSFDGAWTTAYANILQDAMQLNTIADANNYARHSGMSRVMAAYVLLLMVDSFGDVPYSKAFLGAVNYNPPADDQATLYTGTILPMLDKAIIDLKTPLFTAGGNLNPIAPAIVDNYYTSHLNTPSTDYSAWVRLANTLKLKVYLSLRLSDPVTATAGINAAIASTDGLISTAAQNFVWHYGISTADPDSRHPRFVGGYPAGGGVYQSNWLMWQMFHGYDATHNGLSVGDPRMRFYFYRQSSSNATSVNDDRCINSPIPAHYPYSTGTAINFNSKAGIPPGVGLFNSGGSIGQADNTTVAGVAYNPAHPMWTRTFCFPTNVGYWGRDHVDNQGIPPDNFLRTEWGVYPAGGKFDANNPANVNANVGMQGAGIQPVLMRSTVNFWLAEAALYLGTTGSAATYYQNGIQYSMDDVRSFSSLGVMGGNAVASPVETNVNTFYPLNFAGAFTADVVAASTANIPTLLTTGGLLTIDGVVTLAGDRVLVKNQTTASQNGIYDVVAAGPWTRSASSNTGPLLVNQAVKVLGGNITKNGTAVNPVRYLQTTASPITLGTTSVAWATNGSYTDDVTQYIARAVAAYTAQGTPDSKMNYIARELWISLHGNGVEAYNLYRRTGMPTGMQPTTAATSGPYIRSYYYPQVYAALNSSAKQKADQTVKVFWDKNTSNLDF